MKEAEIHDLWVTKWAIIEELLFLRNKHIIDVGGHR